MEEGSQIKNIQQTEGFTEERNWKDKRKKGKEERNRSKKKCYKEKKQTKQYCSKNKDVK